MTVLRKPALQGSSVIVVKDQVDWQPGEELVLTTTETSHKHFDTDKVISGRESIGKGILPYTIQPDYQ